MRDCNLDNSHTVLICRRRWLRLSSPGPVCQLVAWAFVARRKAAARILYRDACKPRTGMPGPLVSDVRASLDLSRSFVRDAAAAAAEADSRNKLLLELKT